MKSLITKLVLVCLLIASNVGAATYWVSTSGSDSNPCFNSATQPNSATQSKQTITAGINCLSPGDTLYIKAGSYAERIQSRRQTSPNFCDSAGSGYACIPSGTSWTSMTTVSAAPGDERKVWICRGVNVDTCVEILGFHHFIAIKGLYIDGREGREGANPSNPSTILHRAVQIGNCPSSSSNPLRAPCKASPSDPNFTIAQADAVALPHSILFENNHVAGAWESGALYCPLDGIFRGNRFTNNGHTTQDHGIYISGRCTVEYNELDHNTGNGFQNWLDINNYRAIVRYNYVHDNGNGIYNGVGEEHETYGNVVTNNANGGIRCWASNGKCYNNTVYNNGWGTTPSGQSTCVDPGGSAESRNNLCINNANNYDMQYGTESNNFYGTSSSVFVNAAAGNYQLASSTPAGIKDAGATLGSPWNIDANGVTRPTGAYDIGACEWFSGATQCPSLQAQVAPLKAPSAPSNFHLEEKQNQPPATVAYLGVGEDKVGYDSATPDGNPDRHFRVSNAPAAISRVEVRHSTCCLWIAPGGTALIEGNDFWIDNGTTQTDFIIHIVFADGTVLDAKL